VQLGVGFQPEQYLPPERLPAGVRAHAHALDLSGSWVEAASGCMPGCVSAQEKEPVGWGVAVDRRVSGVVSEAVHPGLRPVELPQERLHCGVVVSDRRHGPRRGEVGAVGMRDHAVESAGSAVSMTSIRPPRWTIGAAMSPDQGCLPIRFSRRERRARSGTNPVGRSGEPIRTRSWVRSRDGERGGGVLAAAVSGCRSLGEAHEVARSTGREWRPIRSRHRRDHR